MTRPSTTLRAGSLFRRSWTWTIVLVAALGGVSSHSGVTAGAQEPARQLAAGIPPETLAQIDALIREKESRSATERKIDSQLLYRQRIDSGQLIAPGVANLVTDVPYASDGHAIVDVKARITPDLLSRLSAMGIEVLSSEGSTLRAHISIGQVHALAALADVAFVQPRQEARLQAWRRPVTTGARGHQAIAQALAQSLSSAVNHDAQPNVYVTNTGQGSRSSEGDITHLAYAARHAFNVNGTGVKIGVLSDGVTNLAASQAAGDLGPVTVLTGQAGSGDEGTAMLEIVHDLAPGAQLYFATAFTSLSSFANNIRALRTAGCDIIVDDVFYYVESPFQDGQTASIVSNTNGGIVTQAVNDVTAAGALYFSSAGNEGNLNDGTSGTWEGDFVDGGASGLPTSGSLHNFGGGQAYDIVTVNGPLANLYWSDPLGGSVNDYDLFRLNSVGTLIASSTNIQSGTQDPYEAVPLSSTLNDRLVIVKKPSAAARFLHLSTNGGLLSIATAGETHGHSTAAAAYSVAATPAAAPFGSGPYGPFPNPFNAANTVETFSSDGPRRLFFQANGTAYTPGNFLSTGGLLRQKPDLAAADGVSVTGVGGFGSPFFGTSAAAPHAAAIAALLKSGNPALTPAQVRTALTSSAIDIEGPGVDRDAGAGIVMPRAALSAAGVPGTAWLDIATVAATDNPGNGNGAPEAGEGALVDISLVNYGVSGASSITATLTSSTPGITVIQPAARTYPSLAASMSSLGSGPYQFTVASNYPCPQAASFTLSVSYTGGSGSQVIDFKVPIGPPAYAITTTLDATAPPPTPPFVATSTGTQNRRLNRQSGASMCGAPKTTPPLASGVANRRYEAYAFNTCSTSAASCVTVTLEGANDINLFSAAYAPSFSSNNVTQNYKGDPGTSGKLTSYAFDVPAGAQTFAVDVHEVNAGAGIGTQYTLKVAGACMGACAPPNNVPVAIAHNVTVTAGVTGTANASINNGSFDPDGDVLTLTQSPSGPYPIGQTSVVLTVTDPKGAAAQASGIVTVTAQSFPPPTISINDASVQEGNAGMVPAVFQVTLSNATSATVTVNYATSNLTAVAPVDYQAASGMISFAPGEVSKPISVLVAGDTATESTETFQVNLSAPVNGSIADAQAIGTIVDDDPATVNESTVTQAIATGSARLQSLQQADGGWFFKVGDSDCGLGPGVTCDNTLGVIGLGLLAARTRSCASTCNETLKQSAQSAADRLVAIYDDSVVNMQPRRPFSQDIEFLVEFGVLSGNPVYGATAQSWFGVLVAQYATGAGRVDALITFRNEEGLRTLAAWDSASLIRAAKAVGNVIYADSAAARIVERESEWKDTTLAHRWDQCAIPAGCGPADNPLAYDYTLLGEGSLLRAFNDLGGYGAKVNEYRAHLLASQDSAGSYDAGDIQITAYVSLGLGAVGGTGTDTALQSAVRFFLTTQLPTHGWPSYVIPTSVGAEYPLLVAEVVRAIFTLYNTPAGSSVFVAAAQLSGMTFAGVTSAGFTSVVAVDPPAHLRLPRGYESFRNLHYDVRTTAAVRGPAVACFVLPWITDAQTFATVRILQEEHKALVDRTIESRHSQYAPDFDARRVCARTPSLGRFAVATVVKPAKSW